MKLSIIAPTIFGNDCITEPHVVKQLWKDAICELGPVPRSQMEWVETGRELRQSIEQEGLTTTFEVADPACVVPLLLFVLKRFVCARNPVAEYVDRRYSGQSETFRNMKVVSVGQRMLLAADLRSMLMDQPVGTLMNREGEPFQFPLSADFKVGTSWDDLPALSRDELVRTFGVPANLMGDMKSHNLATVPSMGGAVEPKTPCALCAAGHKPTVKEAHSVEPGSLDYTLTTPKPIGSIPMREDVPVQPVSEAITESLNRVKRTNCRHCEEEVFWVKTPAGKHFLADNLKQRRELSNIDVDGNTEAGQQHIVCIPHYCPAMQERVSWPKGPRPAHPLKERLWSLMIEAGLPDYAASQTIEAAFKPEKLVPIKRDPSLPGDRVFEQAAAEKAPPMFVPTREWGIIREMARLLHETADRGSELNLEDRKRLHVTADLAEAAVAEGAKGAVEILLRDGCKLTIGSAGDVDLSISADLAQAELTKIQADFHKLLEEWNHPTIPAGPMIPLIPIPESEGSD